MSNTTDTVHKLGFADDEIAECLEKKGLLSIELEFTKKCNLRCLYCYSSAGDPFENELNLDELKSVISQAKDLGVKKIILLGGGEPLIYSGVSNVINYIDSLGLQQVLFTNGTLVTKEWARFLFHKKVTVITKSNSLKSEVQDMLAGRKGVFGSIRKGLEFLLDAGYPNGKASLGIQTIICRQNIAELPSMWIWARENRIIPYFEILTYQGRAKENIDLNVPVSEVKSIFERLETIDGERFGILWKSRPTIAAFSCKRHFYSCLINSQGYVQPCPGIDMSVGNIREKPLRDILESSHVITNLRNISEKIEGTCKTCEYRYECYGCRGNAYQITGNYLSSDPTCWRFKKNHG
ncbi:MAG: radical SAM protein [Candidatus Brocadia sp.]|nr:radical SAM protein [Candidatus Brocadia sp.]